MKEIIGQLKPYAPEEPQESVKTRLGIDRLVRLSANENPYGTSPKVKAAIQALVENHDANYYPDGYAASLRTALSKKFDIPENQFVIGVGLDEVISLVSRTFLNKGDSILVSVPAFSEYALNGQIEGATVKSVPCDPITGHYDYESLIAAVDETTKLVWLCNPNNPTGTYETVESLRSFISAIPKSTIVIIDEAYIDFVTAVEQPSAMELLNEFGNIALMRTFSKAYGLANYRVGYMIMTETLTNYVQTIRLPYNLNTLSQIAAEAALGDEEFLHTIVEQNRVERERWEDLLTELGIIFFHSEANFIYMNFDKVQYNSDQVADAWLQAGYQVRRGLQPNWLRVTIGKSEDCAVMRDVLKGLILGK